MIDVEYWQRCADVMHDWVREARAKDEDYCAASVEAVEEVAGNIEEIAMPLIREAKAARAWRDAQAEADAALARAADINQGCEPGSKRGAHREAVQAEQRAREARDRYDTARRGAVAGGGDA